MFVQWLARRQMAKFLAAFEALDADRLAQFWPDDVIVTFQPGTPMAGEWHGRAEAKAVMRALFAENASLKPKLHWLAFDHPWSPTGTFRAFVEWSAVEVGMDGTVYDAQLVTAAEYQHWKVVRSRDYFFDVPGCAAHYATMKVPPRQGSTQLRSTAA